MAAVTARISLDQSVEEVWRLVSDFARPDLLAPGFVVRVEMPQDGRRTVVFDDGNSVQEVLVSNDVELRRMSYAAVGGVSEHHSSAMQVEEDGSGSAIVWTTDVLPDELAPYIEQNVRRAGDAIRRNLSAS